MNSAFARVVIACTAIVCCGAGLSAGERAFCQGDNCIPDLLAVRFGDPAERRFEERANLNDEVDIFVTADVVSENVQGWSMAVAHDTALLEILEVTTEGLDLPGEFFNTTTAANGDPAPGFVSAVVLNIFPVAETLPIGQDIPLVTAKYRVIGELDPNTPTLLEFMDNTLIPAEGSPPTANNFTIDNATGVPETVVDGEIFAIADGPGPGPGPGEDGTPFSRGDCNGNGAIDLSDAVICSNSIFGTAPGFFDCDNMLDANDDGVLDAADPAAIFDWYYREGPALPPPFNTCEADDDDDLACAQSNCSCDNFAFYFGTDPNVDVFQINGDSFTISMRNITPSAGFSLAVQVEGTDYSFADGVFGPDELRTVALAILDDRGLIVRPDNFNSATGPDAAVTAVTKGPALEGGSDDFFSVDLAPTGGNGFTVAYTTDLGAPGDMIAASGTEGAGCLVNEILVVSFGEVPVGCPDWAFIFGPDVAVPSFEITESGFPINMRNSTDALAFSLGVQIEGNNYSFSDETLGTADDRLIELIITDNQGVSQKPAAPNTATDTAGPRAVVNISEGAAIADIEADFFTIDLAPAVGGPGFTIGYVADTSGTGAVVPATPSPEGECPLNEIAIVSFEGGIQDFFRGDADPNGFLNVTDAVVDAQAIFLDRLRFVDCDDMFDANDDGMLDGADPIAILEYVFLAGAELPAPFLTCGPDGDDSDDLGCNESNCIQ